MSPQPLPLDSPQTRIAIVDDDDLFRESLGLNLAEAGFEVADFAGGQSALDYLLSGNHADVVLLDWRMPGLDGPAVLRALREAEIHVPVIFLTMLSDEVYEEAALKWGAVDFIDKSRRLSIILGRLRLITEGAKPIPAQAGRPGAPGAETALEGTLRRGPLELRQDIHRAYWRGAPVELTLSEFAIVRYMAIQSGGDVTYRQIYDVVRGKDFAAGYGAEGFRANVRSFIKRIRKKFRDVDPEFDGIDNYPGFGYRWRDEAGDEEPTGPAGSP
ncbi:MAG: response regulator transcription factor [Proteobacteria bacterium]|nr:response regulator transcription factor [Pseudomonadota bacterium]